jgi:hypothetical protein
VNLPADRAASFAGLLEFLKRVKTISEGLETKERRNKRAKLVVHM